MLIWRVGRKRRRKEFNRPIRFWAQLIQWGKSKGVRLGPASEHLTSTMWRFLWETWILESMPVSSMQKKRQRDSTKKTRNTCDHAINYPLCSTRNQEYFVSFEKETSISGRLTNTTKTPMNMTLLRRNEFPLGATEFCTCLMAVWLSSFAMKGRNPLFLIIGQSWATSEWRSMT